MEDKTKGLSEKEMLALKSEQAKALFNKSEVKNIDAEDQKEEPDYEELFFSAVMKHLREVYPQENINNRDTFFSLAYSEWEETIQENVKMRAEYEKIFDAIDENPRLAVLLSEIMKGEPIRVALVKSGVYTYEPKEGESDYHRYCECIEDIKRTKKDIEQRRSLREKNLEMTTTQIEEFYADKKLNEEQIDDFAFYVQQMIDDMVDGKITIDTMQRLWLGYTFEEQIEIARNAGMVEGQNKNIETISNIKNSSDGLPQNKNSKITVKETPRMGYIERIMGGQYR